MQIENQAINVPVTTESSLGTIGIKKPYQLGRASLYSKQRV